MDGSDIIHVPDQNRTRRKFQHAGVWALLSLLLFVITTWPLARFVQEGIPSSAHNHETPPWRSEIAGDHMQLLYHFDMVHDMMAGRVPWLHNIWEFNVGDDSARFRPGGFFMPGAAVYGTLRFLMPQAAAWNMTLWISIWISMAAIWAWMGQFTKEYSPRILGLTFLMLIPFRWASLLGGSPAGIGLMWISLLALLMDRALRRPGYGIGVLLGSCILFLFWADLQIFYLTMVTLPAFALMTLPHLDRAAWRSWPRWLKLSPGMLLSIAIIGASYLWRKRYLAGSLMEDGRDWHELSIYSPRASALWTHRGGISETVFLSPWTAAALIAAFLLLLIRLWKNRDSGSVRLFLSWILLLGAVSLGVMLALGPYGPRSGTAIRLARTHIPYYGMIRQPTKIFAVVPFWIAWLLAVGFQTLPPPERLLNRIRGGLIAAFTLGIGLTFFQSVSTTIALLPGDQPAYRAVAADAGTDTPRALVVPLWPGDSAETSIPLFFAHRHGIRLVNGYSPVVQQAYMENIFRGLESVNMGHLEDTQIDQLLEMGVTHLLVHENRFPEKVSPFPIHETVWRLEGNPRIERLARAGPVRALRLLREPKAAPPSERPFPAAFAARRWEVEHMSPVGGKTVPDEHAGRGAFWRVNADRDEAAMAETRPARMPPGGDLLWWIRVRGQGRVLLSTFRGDEETARQTLETDWDQWHWQPFPVEAGTRFDPVTLRITPESGQVDLDLIVLGAGDWPLEIPANGLEIPAVSFFRAGHPGDDEKSIVFLAERDPAANLLYGPKLPFPADRPLRLELRFETEAPAGTMLGGFYARIPETGRQEVPVIAGKPAVLHWRPGVDLPAEIGFSFSRNADLIIHSVRIEY